MTSLSSGQSSIAVSASVGSSSNQYHNRFFTTEEPVDKDKSLYYISQDEPEYKLGKHRSNALGLLEKQDVIEVEGNIAVCDGGGGALGHPLEYIKVGGIGGKAVSCIYCGLKYKQKGAH
eukprot:CAMPEP_0178960616 /NCGR_PEP_ID=MMETSP0789-20121207/13073_1 /TAXON_ID=3005 /ORGANISM="Rhizosolenia setigera, Strain CCMP 1694" /LENGTH=118 /DNA_ID=CAMNT_0020644005 /DNA_START=149 /DNA_END=505 /DNA_ORIENTATION=-